MWNKFKTWVLRFFGKSIDDSDDKLQRDELDAKRYMNISTENITAIISNALSVLVFGDAQMSITPESAMQELMQEVLDREFTLAKRNVSCGLGVGLIASIPYCVDNGLGRKIYVDTVTKDRVFITGMQGSDITQCVVLADIRKIDNQIYTRWTEYEVNGGRYTIRNKCIREGVEFPLTHIDAWAEIVPEITISGVDKLPIGFFRCPTGARRPDDITGVPITFGCDATLQKIATTLEDIEIEFKRKKTKVFADRSLIRPQYDENGNLVQQTFDEDLFVKFGSSDNFTTEIFSPEFRDTSYYTKLQSHFEFLEKQIGLSKGILTELNTRGATATEIKRSTYQTFCLVDDIRKEYEQYINDLAYGVEVLAVAYGLAGHADFDINIDWSYAMLEDSQESFNQLTQAVSLGAESLAGLRQFIHPEETYEEAEEEIAKIAENAKGGESEVERMLNAMEMNNKPIMDNEEGQVE